MPNVPQDTRFGDLGQGIGTLLGGVIAAKKKQQVSEGVSQILADPTLDPDAKQNAIMRKYGQEGLDALQEVRKSQLVSKQIEAASSEIEERRAETMAAQARTAESNAKLPYVSKQAQADLDKDTAETQAAKSTTARNNMMAPIEAGEAKARTTLYDSEAKKNQSEADKLAQSVADSRLGPAGKPNNITQEDWNSYKRSTQVAIQQAIQSGHPDKVPELIVQGTKQSDLVGTEPLPQPVQQQVEGAAGIAQAMDGIAGAMKQGNITRGPTSMAEQWLVKKGISPGSPEFNEFKAETDRLVSEMSKGQGFFSKARVDFAHEITPNVVKSPLYNAVEMLAVLKSQKTMLMKSKELNEGTKYSTKAIDSTIADIDNQIENLKPKYDKYGNEYFQGNIVNPKTFDIQMKGVDGVEPDGTYNFGKNSISGADIYQMAKEKKTQPAVILDALTKKYGPMQASDAN